jgi:hypothetical protein
LRHQVAVLQRQARTRRLSWVAFLAQGAAAASGIRPEFLADSLEESAESVVEHGLVISSGVRRIAAAAGAASRRMSIADRTLTRSA